MLSTDIKTLSEDLKNSTRKRPIHNLDQENCHRVSKPQVDKPQSQTRDKQQHWKVSVIKFTQSRWLIAGGTCTPLKSSLISRDSNREKRYLANLPYLIFFSTSDTTDLSQPGCDKLPGLTRTKSPLSGKSRRQQLRCEAPSKSRRPIFLGWDYNLATIRSPPTRFKKFRRPPCSQWRSCILEEVRESWEPHHFPARAPFSLMSIS